MQEISALLGDGDDHGRGGRRAGAAARPVVIRSPRPGDLGWVVHRHGAVYAAEFGWNADFERWVARIIADFMDNPDPARAAAWIAEVDGTPAGSVLCVPDDGHGDGGAGDAGGEDHTGESTARLRVLLVERWARGLGIGARLVDEVLAFATQAGYKRITLSTYDVLASARRIYQAAGFTLVHGEPERAFGLDLTAQEWARDL
jgi:GNAT superfamily N-acetyltransferase